EPEARELRPPQRLAERLPDAALVEWRALVRAEDPGWHRRPPALHLLHHPVDLEAAQRLGELLAHVHPPSRPRLGRLDFPQTPGSLHAQLACAMVEIAPLEPEGLAGPEPRPREEQEERIVARVLLCRREEGGDLLR